jgi:hypothetical protein
VDPAVSPRYLGLELDHETISRAIRLAYNGREFMGPA